MWPWQSMRPHGTVTLVASTWGCVIWTLVLILSTGVWEEGWGKEMPNIWTWVGRGAHQVVYCGHHLWMALTVCQNLLATWVRDINEGKVLVFYCVEIVRQSELGCSQVTMSSIFFVMTTVFGKWCGSLSIPRFYVILCT